MRLFMSNRRITWPGCECCQLLKSGVGGGICFNVSQASKLWGGRSERGNRNKQEIETSLQTLVSVHEGPPPPRGPLAFLTILHHQEG